VSGIRKGRGFGNRVGLWEAVMVDEPLMFPHGEGDALKSFE
jgi:hypothetical protein